VAEGKAFYSMDLQSILHTLSLAALPVLFAITLHEVAHGWVARYFGDRTAEAQGRLSLNPLKHVDPVGTVLVPGFLLLVGSGFLFGWAKPVPVDARYLRNPRRDMAWVSAAGPGVNLAMAFGWAVLGAIATHGWFGTGTAAEWILGMARIGLFFNVLLAVFNMLPIPPLDGGRVMVSLLPTGPSRALERIEPYGFMIVLGLFLVVPMLGGPNVFRAVLGPPIQFLMQSIVSIVS
jgi:Zn-dependent protease